MGTGMNMNAIDYGTNEAYCMENIHMRIKPNRKYMCIHPGASGLKFLGVYEFDDFGYTKEGKRYVNAGDAVLLDIEAGIRVSESSNRFREFHEDVILNQSLEVGDSVIYLGRGPGGTNAFGNRRGRIVEFRNNLYRIKFENNSTFWAPADEILVDTWISPCTPSAESGGCAVSEDCKEEDVFVPWDDHEIEGDEDDEAAEPAADSNEDAGVEAIVVRPTHYTRYDIEPVTFIMRNRLSFEIGNIVKYALRAGHKIYPGMDSVESEIVDLEKVRRYAEMRINMLKGRDHL